MEANTQVRPSTPLVDIFTHSSQGGNMDFGPIPTDAAGKQAMLEKYFGQLLVYLETPTPDEQTYQLCEQLLLLCGATEQVARHLLRNPFFKLDEYDARDIDVELWCIIIEAYDRLIHHADKFKGLSVANVSPLTEFRLVLMFMFLDHIFRYSHGHLHFRRAMQDEYGQFKYGDICVLLATCHWQLPERVKQHLTTKEQLYWAKIEQFGTKPN